MNRKRALAPVVLVVSVLQAACASRSRSPTTMPCEISVKPTGQIDVAHLPALSADGATIAVPEFCEDGSSALCLAIAIRSIDGDARERIDISEGPKRDDRIRRVNQLLANSRFTPMSALELPFSARDLNVMTLRTAGVIIHYDNASLLIQRDDRLLARLDIPPVNGCGVPWIRSLFLDTKAHVLAAELEYHEGTGCAVPPPTWRVVRFQ